MTVSFLRPSGRRSQETISMPGLEAIALKCEKGARFALPSGLSVLIQAMGRGEITQFTHD
jgi:hypothetical protein